MPFLPLPELTRQANTPKVELTASMGDIQGVFLTLDGFTVAEVIFAGPSPLRALIDPTELLGDASGVLKAYGYAIRLDDATNVLAPGSGGHDERQYVEFELDLGAWPPTSP